MAATAEPPTDHKEGASEHRFQAEVNQVLDIVVHSLYSHREIFLRELISNASDALDKVKFRALTEHELLGEEKDLEIRLAPDRDAKTLAIVDTGVGMTKDELIENLGTIAHSGSRRFLEAMKEAGKGEGVDLIGQFGVGFYSAFLVAEQVEVVSRAAGADEAWRWRSTAKGTFTVEPAPEKRTRGTEVILHLGEEHREFVDEWKLRDLVQRYSDYVSHPIKLRVEREEEAEAEGEADEPEKAKETKVTFETINKGSALWRRPRSDIEDEQYKEFYKHLTHDFEEPLAWTHFQIEGTQLFTGLIFIPKRPPFDLFDRARRRGVRLYVKRVFIMDDCEALIPEWLRFVRGIVDSDDLPLNVSRELLQEERVTRTIRKQVVKKTLDLLEELANDRPDDYAAFWKHFGIVLKEALHSDWEHKERIAKLVRFESSKEELTSLSGYLERMPEGQKDIYYVVGESRAAVEGSPHTEAVQKRGYEVLYLTDPVDEWAVEGLREFEGKRLVSAMRDDLDLGETDEEKKELEEKKTELSGLLERAKEVLSDHVREVRVSGRLTDSPCCLVVPPGGLHAQMERLLRAHDRSVPEQKRIFELNPAHDLVKALARLHEADPTSERVREWIEMLHDHALITEGSPIKDPQAFARRLAGLLGQAAEQALGG